MTVEIIADHCCGFDYDIYQDGEDKEWYFKQYKHGKAIIINFCPMCGKGLNGQHYCDDGI